ncbi:MAG: alpha/beta hydrolase-fold protein, partial [Cyclobacteriaceae bacterium]|nr:alpha/beta hydrolase-fold protein [Cyclobacteriaceae bacterium]
MKTIRKMMLTMGLILSVLLSSCNEEIFDPALTRTFTIESSSIGATYPIQVALPENYNTSGEKFSTIYVLDGEQDFDLVASTCKSLSDRYSVRNVLVVSIGYGRNRSIDYTPTKT